MKETFLELKEKGCDIERALKRFFGDDDLYLQCYGKMMESENFDYLEKWIRENQKEEGLKCTHALKGSLANLEIHPLRDMVLAIETFIKEEAWQQASKLCEELQKTKDEYKNIL